MVAAKFKYDPIQVHLQIVKQVQRCMRNTTAVQPHQAITDIFGEQCFGLYTEVAFVEGLFCTQIVHLGPGCLAVI